MSNLADTRDFATVFRAARVQNKVTLRRIQDATGKSISYWSDVEHRRKAPPSDIVTITTVEGVLGIDDGSLVTLAAKARRSFAPEIRTMLRQRPRVAEILMRAAEDFSDDEIQEALADYDEKRRQG